MSEAAKAGREPGKLTQQQKAAAVIISLGAERPPSSTNTWTRRMWNN